MKKVLFVLQSNVISGAETVLKEYLKHCKKSEPLYLLTNQKIQPYFADILPPSRLFAIKSMKRVFFGKNPWPYLLFLYNTMRNMFIIHRIVKNKQIDVLYGNNSIDTVQIVLYKRFMNNSIKTVAHLHDMFTDKSMIGSFIKRNAKHLDKILVPSNATKQSVEQLSKKNCEVETVYNGIRVPDQELLPDITRIKQRFNIPERKIVLTFVGAIINRKRPDLFTDIIAELANHRDDFIAIMVGNTDDKSLQNAIINQVQTGQLPLKTLGRVKPEQMASIYHITDYLLLTSDRDPLPTVILESMAHGKIPISRNVDGASEMIHHNENGFLFDYDATPAQIANLIDSILDMDDANKKIIKHNAVHTIHHTFNNSIKVEKINGILQNL